MAKGGFHPLARAEQGLAEIQVGAVVYAQLDAKEDSDVEALLRFSRGVCERFAPSWLPALDRWEQRWRSADRDADLSVSELRSLAAETSAILGAAPA